MEIKKVSKSNIGKVDFSGLGFGDVFTDHMVSMSYEQSKWGKPMIEPYGAVKLEPSVSAIHYGQSVFEGLKAFNVKDGSINIFRMDKHIDRMERSCHRLCIPLVDKDTFRECIIELVKLERSWVPKQKGYSLYIRPFIFASDSHLGAHVSHNYKFMIILSPVGAYYKEGINPVSLVTAVEHARSVEGGVGAAKTAGNYAASLFATNEAQQKGFTQVLWLDGVSRLYVEEVGTMNVFFVIGDELITPHLSGTILAGVTRDSVLHIARDWGLKVSERKLLIDEVMEAAAKGTLKEAFGTGTAAVISPIGKIQHKGKDITINNYKPGELAVKLYDALTGIQYGEKPDKFGWITNIK
jgi:branched-chain amino acid aminotransferase